MSIHSGAHVRLPRLVCCRFSLHEALQRAGLLGCAEEGSADRQGHRLDPSGAWRWRHAARFCSGFFEEDFRVFSDVVGYFRFHCS